MLADNISDRALEYVKELPESAEKPQTNHNFWFSTPDNPGDPSSHTPIQSRILRKIQELESIKKLKTHSSPKNRASFLANIKWEDSQLNEKDKVDIADILVEYNDIFARHRLDIGVKNEFKIKLTPQIRSISLHTKFALPC